MKKKPCPAELKTKINFPVFGFCVHVVFSKDVVASRTKRSDWLGCYHMGSAAALHSYATDNESESWLFLRFDTGIEQIVHESYHAIHRMLEITGCKHDTELVAYHLGHLASAIAAFMHRSNDLYEYEKKKLTARQKKSKV